MPTMTDADWMFEARAVLDQGKRIISALRERLGSGDAADPILESWLKDYHAICPNEAD